ncbi:unnamed protein product (macronuclear) [Paramecium tetraurelia]|uniref:Uncharacterized protein n=1 Tax=Paramecium tetraurelia TaxID=5888 RepID=A0BPC7_PARTE|nr:uncharacterized protein GSPATT00005143001 [Paramecium tetraurelia]CAK60394.1 unnamed protein product [Paramecium tetraurelia]|eukprot:XP_001427792.1 hypothetical protein (macronuclear) [Paramecium tetraurelia strain d4-2]
MHKRAQPTFKNRCHLINEKFGPLMMNFKLQQQLIINGIEYSRSLQQNIFLPKLL